MKNNLNLTKPQLWSFRHFPWAKIEGLRQQGGKTFYHQFFVLSAWRIFSSFTHYEVLPLVQRRKNFEKKVKFFAFFLSPHLFFFLQTYGLIGKDFIQSHFIFFQKSSSLNKCKYGTSYIKFCKLPRVTWRISPRGFCVWKVYDRATVCQSFLSLLYTQGLTCN